MRKYLFCFQLSQSQGGGYPLQKRLSLIVSKRQQTAPKALLPALQPSSFSFLTTQQHFFFLKNKGNGNPLCSLWLRFSRLLFMRVFFLSQLAQLVIDLNNQMQQKDREMQLNEAK